MIDLYSRFEKTLEDAERYVELNYEEENSIEMQKNKF